jgi:hypothetical protein
VCVTDNIAEFRRLPALKVENWVRLADGPDEGLVDSSMVFTNGIAYDPKH